MKREAASLAALLLLASTPAAAQRLHYERVDVAEGPRLGYAALDLEGGSGSAAAQATGRPANPAPGQENERVREFYFDRNEILFRRGAEGYSWDWSAYLGGSTNRLFLAATGDGTFGGPLDYLELQALYSRSIGNFDLQAGVRWDAVPRPRRVYATLGAQGYAIPDIFYLGGLLFLSHQGEASARIFGTYDIPLAPRLILQPAFETEIAAQDVPDLGIGAGPVYGEAGLRLRYRVGRGETQAFSPYVGINYERLFGRTARLARDEGEDVEGFSLLAGIRSWF
ncbi:MAG TPA: copper resistance protein B [Allosphingosinicella sp.]|nr:copper resistance protein B [Allosphingosinicella sp.]